LSGSGRKSHGQFSRSCHHRAVPGSNVDGGGDFSDTLGRSCSLPCRLSVNPLCALVGAVFHALHSFTTTALRDGSPLHAVHHRVLTGWLRPSIAADKPTGQTVGVVHPEMPHGGTGRWRRLRGWPAPPVTDRSGCQPEGSQPTAGMSPSSSCTLPRASAPTWKSLRIGSPSDRPAR
jgi:hypothetical protein